MILSENISFIVPITRSMKQKAEQLANSFPHKKEQIYNNFLAVAAVQFYLDCMGIKTELENSSSQAVVIQVLADIADLLIPGVGLVECRPVLADEDMCFVPPEVWSDRIAYLVVNLDYDRNEAEILGFLPQVEQAKIPLERLQSLDNFITHVDCIQNPVPVKIRDWVKAIMSEGWLTLEELAKVLDPSPQVATATGWRKNPTASWPGVKTAGAKILSLGRSTETIEYQEDKIALLVGLGEQNQDLINIHIRLVPWPPTKILPEGVHLSIINNQDEVVINANASRSPGLEVDFMGQTDEQFGVKVTVGKVAIAESFVI